MTISPTGVKIVEKGHRLGREMSWRDLLSGDAELASQLMRSVSPPVEGDRAKHKAAPPTRTPARKRRA